MHYELTKYSWRGALFCLCLALTAAGCSMSDDLDCPPGDSQATAGKAYIRLSFAMPGSGSTRANPSGGELGDGQEAGQQGESTISSAVAFLYKATDGVDADGDTEIDKVIEFNGLNVSDDGTGQNENGHDIDQYYTVTQEVPDIDFGTYHVIVATNLTENLSSGDVFWRNSQSLTLDDVRDHILKNVWKETPSADGKSTTYSYFVMTNEKDATVMLAAENTSENNPATTTVDVERVAARVDYRAKNEYTCTDLTYEGGTVKILGATIVNDYTAGSFLLKRVADDVTGTTNMSYLGNETTVTAGTANYVLDPNTAKKTKQGTANSIFDTRSTLYAQGTHSSNWRGDPIWWEGKVTKGKEITVGNETWYCIGYTLENTTPSGTNFAGAKEYNTGVVFQAQFTPADGTVNSDYSKDTYNYTYQAKRTFFEYGGQLYATMEDLANSYFPATKFSEIKTTLNCDSWEKVEALKNGIPDNDPSGYKNFLEGKINEHTEWSDELKSSLSWTAYMRDVCGYTFDADNGGVKLDWTGGGTKPQGAKSTREILYANGVRTYENSKCYYTWWLLHSNDLTDDASADNNVEGVMEHAVVRNNIYKLSVESIYSLGDDVPGSTSLRVRARVNDWVLLQNEEITFGPTGNN